MAYIGPNSPSTAADDSSLSGDTWSNPNNAKALDATYATAVDTNPNHTHYLKTTNYGFSIPAGSDIQGIVVEVTRHASGNGTNNVTDYAVKIVKSDGSIGVTNKADTVTLWPTSDAVATYGSVSDLWGESWTSADINNSDFGVAFSADLHPDTTVTAYVDYIAITVYYSTGVSAGNIDMQKRYIYKVYDSASTYLGRLPRPSSDFSFSQDINTGGVQIKIQLPVSADTSSLPSNDAVLDESGANVLDEGSNNILSDGANLILGLGGGADELIKNGNEIVVVEYGYYHPNGITMFRGRLKRWEANFGGDGQDDTIDLTVYSDGQDLTNHLIRGYGLLVADQIQTVQDDFGTVTSPSFILVGQTFTTGSGVNNIGAITIYAAVVSTTNTVTIHLCLSPGGAEIGSTSMNISSTTAAAHQFVFASPIAVSPSTSYFFYVTASDSSGVKVYLHDTVTYSGGHEYLNVGSGWGIASSQEMYFETYAAPLSTVATYTSKDPTTQILEPVLDAYATEGGAVTYNGSSIDATGLSLSYTFNTNTVYFKQANTVADIVLTKGKHLNQIKIVATTEYVANEAYFTGGVVAGSNIYTLDQDSTSINEYGVALSRLSDNRVTDTATAHAIGSSEVAEKKDEQYQTTVTVVDKTIDTTQFKPGLIIGFNGFGTLVDGLLAQIVHIDYAPNQVTLQLGLLPKRIVTKVEQVTKELIAMSTLGNPSGPS